MENKIPSFLLEKRTPGLPGRKTSSVGSSFVDKGLSYIAGVVKAGYIQWELASGKGFLQKFDARAKVFFLFFFIGIISFKQSVCAEISIGVFIFTLAVFSGVNVVGFYKRVFSFGFFFGFVVALPASLNIISSGKLVMQLVELPKPYDFWGYHVPRQIGLTRQGITGLMMLTLRVANSVALSLLVISTTP
ncbi:MAG TPA: CbiQ family ECF transporter T component, partial [Dissulfurispiraceae bacterium]|nr:CbiQ family ECF transporter T component [Dissulfurispiraceae bacterium]